MRTSPIQSKILTHSAIRFVMAISACGLVACGGGKAVETPVAVVPPVVTPPIVTPPVVPPTNTAPVANTGADRSVSVTSSVAISGKLSSDAQNDPLTYLWTLSSKPTASIATIDNTRAVETFFIADLPGIYLLQLVVNDGLLNSAVDELRITAEAAPIVAKDITNALFTKRNGGCSSYVGSYYANVKDIQRSTDFKANLVIAADGTTCSFTVNEIPNHDFNDASANFANQVTVQSSVYQVAVTALQQSTVTPLALNTRNAIMLNGVVVDLLAAACYGVGNEALGREKIGCGQTQINNPWRYDPMSRLNNFGTDAHNAHPQPDGTYHYHGNPLAMFNVDCQVLNEESPVIGFAADGFPVFGPCVTVNGIVKEAKSSFVLKNNGGARQAVAGYTTPVAGQGSIASANYDGQFRGDYVYSAGAGDLDECNGMTVNGQYGYYITNAYPWVMNCFKGMVHPSMTQTGAALENLLHVHDELSDHSH